MIVQVGVAGALAFGLIQKQRYNSTGKPLKAKKPLCLFHQIYETNEIRNKSTEWTLKNRNFAVF
jgi:hypothetical protein